LKRVEATLTPIAGKPLGEVVASLGPLPVFDPTASGSASTSGRS
jgi:hypothetical protein